MPTFWLALICLYVFFFRLPWVPGGGRLDPGVLAAALTSPACTHRRPAGRPVVDGPGCALAT